MNEDEVVSLYEAGHSVRRVAALVGTSDRKAVTRILRERGVSIRGNWTPVDWIGDGSIRCSVCGEVKPADAFLRKRPADKGGAYHLSFCKPCKVRRDMDWRARTSPWADKLYRLARRAKERGIECTLTVEQVERLWAGQRGLCFYTDLPMSKQLGIGFRPDAASFDRVCHDGGYTLENVVLCQHRINTAKTNFTMDELRLWMPEWHRRLELRASQA
jgi:hypothetical protein